MGFIRNYKIDILPPEGKQITIEPPFSAKFSVVRNTLASANTGDFEIIGLGPSTRSALFKDRYNLNEYWQIIVQAGYKDQLATIFQGNIYEAFSSKKGVNWITKISGYDGLHGIQNGFTSQTVGKNTDKKTIIEKALNDMPNVIKGVITTGSGEEPSPRGQVLLGQSSDIINKTTGGQYFIDNEVLNAIGDDEYLEDVVLEVTSDVLLETPQRRETYIECMIQFFPQAKIGLLCRLDSLIKEYNGVYKIVGFSHDVEVSQATSGKATTKLNLYAGANLLRKAT